MAKRKYGAWHEDDMHRALHAFRNGDMGFNECCRQFNIPKPTFNRHLKELNSFANGEVKIIGKQTTLPPDVEKDLVNHILMFESLMFGLTITDVRKLAFQIAERNNLPHNFNKETRIAGKKWFYAFKARHIEISLREPQATSMARVKGFNKENVNHFFDILEKLIDENKIDATRIYNVDETGINTVQNKCQKILGRKGKKKIGSVSSGERGVNTTFVACASASGNYVPPMLIFKRVRMNNDLKVGAPPGSLVEISETGYITSELFLKWFKHFIETVKPSTDKKIILLLDGHTTHSKNLEAIEMARKHGVIMLQLPGHTTHRVQPLDRTFFRPLKSNFNQAIQKWLRTNPGMVVSQYQIAGLCTEAYGKTATIENVANGFRACGVWPADRTVFQESDFAAAENLNKDPASETDNVCLLEESPNSKKARSESYEFADNRDGLLHELGLPETPTLEDLPVEPVEKHGIGSTVGTKTLLIPIESISPIPKPRIKSKKAAKAQKAAILTSSPYKTQLELAKELQLTQEKIRSLKEKLEKIKSKTSIKKEMKDSDKKKKTSIQKNLTKLGLGGNSENITSSTFMNCPSTSKQPSVVIQVQQQDWYCFICETNQIEDMIQCQNCNLWVHDACAGVKRGCQAPKFVCVNCK